MGIISWVKNTEVSTRITRMGAATTIPSKSCGDFHDENSCRAAVTSSKLKIRNRLGRCTWRTESKATAELYGRPQQRCDGPRNGEVWNGKDFVLDFGRGDDDNWALPLDSLERVLNAFQGKWDEE